MPVPRVSVRNWLRKPIRPREAISNSRRTRPKPLLIILASWPRRELSISVTIPTNFSGRSTTASSMGSQSCPSTFRVMILGLERDSSKPSLRMVSTSTASCSSPRALTR